MLYILQLVQLGFFIYIMWNIRLFVFLGMPNIPHYHGVSLSLCKLNHKTRYKGRLFGEIKRRGIYNLHYSEVTLERDIILHVTPFTTIIPRKLSYGEEVVVYGKVIMLDNRFIMLPTSIICTVDNIKIRKELNRRLSVSFIIAIIVEVVIYVISL